MNKLLFLLLCSGLLVAQNAENGPLSLQFSEAVQRAKEQSPSYHRAINTAENRYWNYRQFKASNLPQVRFNSTFPDYSSSITRVTQPDGTYSFPLREQVFMQGELSIDQNIFLTGGNLSVSSGLQRTNVSSPEVRTDFYSTPISVSYFQPMILYNQLKWQQRIQPLLYKESQRQYDEDLERIAAEVTDLYFAALSAEARVKIAELNVQNNDTLFKIAQGRYNLGKIAENDLLQIELNLLNARNAMRSAGLDYALASRELKRFLEMDVEADVRLNIPKDARFVQVGVDEALVQAQNNRQAVLEFRRRRLEAEQNVAQARSEAGYNLNVRANFGLNQQAGSLTGVYQDPLRQQNLAVQLSFPIVDWGQAKSRVRRAKANQDLVEVNVQQDEVNFEQEIYLQVMNFNMQQDQLMIAARADTVAQKRYDVTKARYLTGKISITDLNLAQSEKDNARLAYINALRSYWLSYYTLRRLTLFDFISRSRVDYDEGSF